MKKKIEQIVSSIVASEYYLGSKEKGLEERELAHAERLLKTTLPSDLRYFYSKMNGFSLMGEILYPIMLSNQVDRKVLGLIEINHIEHYEVLNPMPEHFLPISPNGRGDHYCINLLERNPDGACPVIFWQWDYSYFHPDDIEKTHNSFLEWFEELVTESLK